MGRAAAAIPLILVLMLGEAQFVQAALIVPKGMAGELEYSYRTTRYDTDYTTSSNMLTGRVTTNAYLWQPWFATMGFSLAVTQDRSSESSGADTSSRIVTGEANMNLLPMSRYPFAMRYQVSDSRIDSSSASDNPLLSQSTARQFNRTNLQLSQGYYGNLYRINLRYNNDEAKSDKGELYTQDGYGFDYSLRGSKQNLNANGIYQKQTNSQNSNESDSTVVSVNHNYYPSSYANVDTVASHVRSNNYYSTAASGLTQQITSDIDQASMAMGWRSSASTLRLHGGMRIHQMDYLINNSTATTALQNSGINTSLGASYQFSDRLTGSMSGQYSELRSDTSDVYSHSEGMTLGYTSERQEISGFDYGWNGAVSGTNQQSARSRSEAVNLVLGHGGSRNWMLESRDSVRLSLSQDISEGYAKSSGPATTSSSGGVVGQTRRLGHSMGLGWQSNDLAGSSMAQLTISDSRGIVGDESKSQMANAQLSRSQLIDNRSSLNGNLTWQAWHYTVPGTPDYGMGTTVSAGASYRYARPFTLQRVNFVSDLRVADSQPANGPSFQEKFWDNRLTHEIGMMRSSLGLTYREHRNVQSTMLMLSVKRMF